ACVPLAQFRFDELNEFSLCGGAAVGDVDRWAECDTGKLARVEASGGDKNLAAGLARSLAR
ncbi:MAG: hypothetical protein AAGD11_19195, partial [Planctomycetota bacterium]